VALLEIDDLVVDYGKIRALRGISMRVEPGELVAVIGSNGAGKTTTLKAISGLLRPTSGQVRFDGKAISGIHAHRISAMGLVHVPEGRKIFATQTVEDNLQLGAYLRLRRGEKAAVEEDIAAMYRTFPRLQERRRQLGGTLSGGEQQMLAIARALVAKPRLLLLDEPSMGLAPVVIDEVFALVERLKKAGEVTLLLVEQLAYRALELANRAYVIEQGQIRLSGTGAELLRDEGVRKAYLGSAS
jgi:branched-chain amino acid transport system ATP-binding protein